MYSYTIYTGISHVNQLTKLHPALIAKIRTELDEAALRFGGRPVETQLYRFPPSQGESARKTAEAAAAMHALLQEYDRELYGFTVMITGEAPESSALGPSRAESLLLGISEENGLWVAPEVLDDFQIYLEGRMVDGFFLVESLKDFGPRLEERLPRLLVRAERLIAVRQVLEKMEREEGGRSILLLRGRTGSGKRATLNRALRELYPDDGGSPMFLPFSDDAEDPMEPFIRALDGSMATTMEYLDEEESLWWEREGSGFLEKARKGLIWETSRDQGPVDFLQAFVLYVKAFTERRRQRGRPAYLVADGFSPQSESVSWLRTLLTEFLGRESFRLILIRDSDDFDEVLPIPGKGHEVSFRRPSLPEWESIIRESSAAGVPAGDELAALAESCGGSLYRLFHALLARERGYDSRTEPGDALVASLDRETRLLLFLANAAAGIADSRLLIERVGADENLRQAEAARYTELLDVGLIREDPDGRVRGLPGGPVNGASGDLEQIREAERFGEYLYRRHTEGEALDLFRLFRYLEARGPAARAVAVLDRLLESLLTNRRLRAAGLVLNGPPMAQSDLDAADTESLQNVVGAARLRYVLLTAGAEQARNLVRDGTVSLISGRGAYSDRFRLHSARYFYAVERWDDSLSAAKEALFTFQKSVDHEGETHAHLELALSLLAQGKVRDALEHFGIARRIGTQVSASWGVLRASAMEVITQVIFGNLPRALRECREYRETAHRAGRRDIWLLLTLAAVRLTWDLGRYGEAAGFAEEGRRTARFYGLSDEERVMTLWKGRSLLAGGRDEGRDTESPAGPSDKPEDSTEKNRIEGRRLLVEAGESREAHAFLAESAYLSGDPAAASFHIREARRIGRQSCRLQGEADDWSDGFYPVEGRLSDSGSLLDVLGEWIGGFEAFLSAEGGDESRIEHLSGLLEKDSRRGPRPFSYQYALWAALSSRGGGREVQTRFMSRAFNDLQARAGRFDDNQTKHAWLTLNPWNRRIMEEAQRRRFL